MRYLLPAAAAAALVCAPAFAAPAPAGVAAERCESLGSTDELGKENAQQVVEACGEALAGAPDDARTRYMLGRALYLLERDEEALESLTAAGAGGIAEALHLLGTMHLWGYGTGKDEALAADHYRRALDAGHVPAAVELGRLHASGSGVGKDEAKAVALFQQAADAGIADGELALGYAYETGAGVPQDLGKAVTLYRSAAAKGDHQARYNLGVLSSQGRGLPEDASEAARWYRLAAEAGSTDGMLALAIAHQEGNGVAKDLAEAEAWLRKGIAAGDKVGAPNSLAFMYAGQRRNLAEAATLAEGAHKEAPEDAAVMDTLALIRMIEGRLPEAEALMVKSVAVDPSAEHHARLGDVYAAMDRLEEARTHWRLATEALGEGKPSEVTAAELEAKIAGAAPR
jgi:TPR repeat protein